MKNTRRKIRRVYGKDPLKGGPTCLSRLKVTKSLLMKETVKKNWRRKAPKMGFGAQNGLGGRL